MIQRSTISRQHLPIIMLALTLLSGCESWNSIGEPASAKPTTARYPVDPDIAKRTGNPYRTLKDSQGVLLGDLKTGLPVPALFGGEDAPDPQVGTGVDGTVNRYLWRAALDTVAFMPVDVADVQGGVIQTNWYEDQKRPNERFKIHVFIISDDLSPDGVQVGVFREEREDGDYRWSQAQISQQTAEDLKTIIVNRAMELRGNNTG